MTRKSPKEKFENNLQKLNAFYKGLIANLKLVEISQMSHCYFSPQCLEIKSIELGLTSKKNE